MCSWNWEKLKVVFKEFKLYMKEKKIFQSVSEKRENIYLHLSYFRLVSFGVCSYVQYYFDVVRNELQTIII